MEVMRVLSTTNSPKSLTRAKYDGWNIAEATSTSTITNIVHDNDENENDN